MLALNLGTWNAGTMLKRWARLFANGRDRNTSKHSLVKFREPPPIFGNYIDMAKGDRHCASRIWSLEHWPVSPAKIEFVQRWLG